MQTVKSFASLSIDTGSHEPLLLDNVICIKAFSASSFFKCLHQKSGEGLIKLNITFTHNLLLSYAKFSPTLLIYLYPL